MDTALIVITLLSVGLTGALLGYAVRLQREQQDREDARVAARADELRRDPPAAPHASAPAQRLEAGDESPFTVPVPEAAGAARDRVSFETGQDVLPHVDRRRRSGGRAG